MKKRLVLLLTMLLALGMFLAACGSSNEENNTANNNKDQTENADNAGNTAGNEGTTEPAAKDFSVAMVTDVGGIDDKSFNQSAWEGLQAFGKANNLEKGVGGYDYAQSKSDADYKTNLNRLVRQNYDLIYGIGFALAPAMGDVAQQQPDTNFAIVDSVVEQPNVASITFKEEQGSFLVGVAAALKTKSNKVGFVGGMEVDLIKKFEAGFRAGVKSVNPNIDVRVEYAGSFADAAKGKLIASSMYDSGIDVIYHASGATGNGVFAEAKDRKKNNPDAYIWVIGVDRDQYAEGQVPGTEDNVTLTSMVKRVDVSVQDISTKAMNGEFPGGQIIAYGLNENGIAVADTNKDALTDDILAKVDEYKQKIQSGEIKVPTTREELQTYLDSLK